MQQKGLRGQEQVREVCVVKRGDGVVHCDGLLFLLPKSHFQRGTVHTSLGTPWLCAITDVSVCAITGVQLCLRDFGDGALETPALCHLS